MTESDAPDAGAPPPRANPQLVGHEAAERALAEAARSGRLHHAWLISGPRGVGKATLAYRFARWLLAGGDRESEAGLFGPSEDAGRDLAVDPGDPVARRVAAGGHPDLLTVERTLDEQGRRLRTEIVVGDVRRVSEFLSLTPAEGGWRVVIVDAAEEMNRNAANALLKTLEEPPPQTVLLLVSHAPGRLLPTIRSRCRKLTLGPLSDDTVADLLARHRPDLEAADRQALQAVAEGSIGRALMLADAGGVALLRELVALIAELPEPDAARLHDTTERLARSRDERGAYIAYDVASDLIAWWLARLVRARASGAMPAEAVPGEAEIIARLSARGSLDQWVEVWEKTVRLFGRAAHLNLDRKQVLLNAFFEMARAGA